MPTATEERRERDAEDAVHRAVVRTRAELEENLGDAVAMEFPTWLGNPW